MNPLTTIRQGPYWGAWPSAWQRGLAGGLTARGDKAVGDVIVNLAKMQKRLDEGIKLRTAVADRMRQLGKPTY